MILKSAPSDQPHFVLPHLLAAEHSLDTGQGAIRG